MKDFEWAYSACLCKSSHSNYTAQGDVEITLYTFGR
jgi:hypothetical protein